MVSVGQGSEMEVSKTFIERFDKAAALAREGKPEEALKAYEHIHAPFEDYNEARVMTGEFMGMIEVRKAYCLMDLKRYEDARVIFSSKLVHAALGQFNHAALYDYYYSYSNTLGILGQIKEMNKMMKKAIRVAMQDLGDVKLCEDAWYWVLHWLRKEEDWYNLEGECMEAHAFGVRNKSVKLQVWAGEFSCYAYRGLNKIDKARKSVTMIIKRYKDAQARPEKIRKWEDFLASLDNIGKKAENNHG